MFELCRYLAIAVGSASATFFLTAGQIWQYPIPRSILLALSANTAAIALMMLFMAEAVRMLDVISREEKRLATALKGAIGLSLAMVLFLVINAATHFDRFVACYNWSERPDIGCNQTIPSK